MLHPWFIFAFINDRYNVRASQLVQLLFVILKITVAAAAAVAELAVALVVALAVAAAGDEA